MNFSNLSSIIYSSSIICFSKNPLLLHVLIHEKSNAIQKQCSWNYKKADNIEQEKTISKKKECLFEILCKKRFEKKTNSTLHGSNIPENFINKIN